MYRLVPMKIYQHGNSAMNRLVLVFFLSFLGAFVSKAVQYNSHKEFETVEKITSENIDPIAIGSFFEGEGWLENRMTSNLIDLNGIYQEKAFEKRLTDRSQIKRYQKSYSTWVEQRVCPESPYIDKPVKSYMTSRYGTRVHPLSGRTHVHAGIDFRGKMGDPVIAASAGVVKSASRKGAYGKTIIIEHGNSFTTLYGHLSDYSVHEGQWVNLGQTIGYIGKTGRSTGPHLHFEVRCHNVPLNPRQYLGKMGQLAEVKFRKRVGTFARSATREPAMVKHDPNYYTRMINLQKLKKLGDQPKKF